FFGGSASFDGVSMPVGGSTNISKATSADTTPPTSNITSPVSNQVFTSANITVSGTASDASGILSVTVNGSAATGSSNWSRTITLSRGSNIITVIATDNSANRNTATKTVTVIYNPSDTTPPVITS